MSARRFSDSCLVGRHSFVQDGPRWIDVAAHQAPDAPRVRVRFDSREYFELLERYPKSVNCLAVGRNFEVLLEGVIYEVHE